MLCGGCFATDGSWTLNFGARSHFKALFLISFALKKRIIIEIDGSQHASPERDTARDAVLMAEGFRIARYWNSNDVLLQPLAVLEDILARLVEP